MANDRDPQANPTVFLGAELRLARLAAGITSQDKLAQMLGYDRSVIAKAETGERPPSEDLMKALVKTLGLDEMVTRLAALARRSTGIPAWFVDWVAIEGDAVTLHTWQPDLIPGLLQTPEYARAILASWRLDTDGDIEAKLAARTGRQTILDRMIRPTCAPSWTSRFCTGASAARRSWSSSLSTWHRPRAGRTSQSSWSPNRPALTLGCPGRSGSPRQ